MDQENASQIDTSLPEDALVIDVGGGMAAFPRADWIIDATAYEDRGRLLDGPRSKQRERFSRDTWVQFDLCSREAWPFEENQFDFAVCSHVLEDLRDPIWVCSEISRIAKAGYIEVPSRVVEQSKGIEHPRLAGFHHHRWLVSVRDGSLEFRQKPDLLHVTPNAVVAKVGFWRTINPKHQITTLYWREQLRAREILEFSEEQVVRELCDFSACARSLPQLLVKPTNSISERLRKALFQFRLAWSLS